MSTDVAMTPNATAGPTAGSDAGPGPSPCCPLCGRAGGTPWLSKDGFAVHRCPACASGYVWPMPAPEQIAAVYDPQYLHAEGEFGYAGSEAALRRQKLAQARARRRILHRLGYRGTRALDLGCGDGWWLAALAADHEQLAGIEPMAACRDAARAKLPETPVHRSLDELDPAQRFDLISCYDVLEHLPAPAAVFARLCEHLAPGGYVAIVVPVLDHWTARMCPGDWDQIKPPEHLVYFTRAAVADLVRECGLAPRYAGSAWNRWPRPLPYLPRMLQRPFRPLMKLLARCSSTIERGIADSLLLVAQRPEE